MSSKSIAWLDGLVEPVDASPAVLLDQEEEFVAHPYMEKIIGVSSFQVYFIDGIVNLEDKERLINGTFFVVSSFMLSSRPTPTFGKGVVRAPKFGYSQDF